MLNLSTDKARVLREVHRVLKPGGRVVISDIVSHLTELTAFAGSILGAHFEATKS